jgi:hypothetical protein
MYTLVERHDLIGLSGGFLSIF